jgi:hypothetical protein
MNATWRTIRSPRYAIANSLFAAATNISAIAGQSHTRDARRIADFASDAAGFRPWSPWRGTLTSPHSAPGQRPAWPAGARLPGSGLAAASQAASRLPDRRLAAAGSGSRRPRRRARDYLAGGLAAAGKRARGGLAGGLVTTSQAGSRGLAFGESSATSRPASAARAAARDNEPEFPPPTHTDGAVPSAPRGRPGPGRPTEPATHLGYLVTSVLMATSVLILPTIAGQASRDDGRWAAVLVSPPLGKCGPSARARPLPHARYSK